MRPFCGYLTRGRKLKRNIIRNADKCYRHGVAGACMRVYRQHIIHNVAAYAPLPCTFRPSRLVEHHQARGKAWWLMRGTFVRGGRLSSARAPVFTRAWHRHVAQLLHEET